MFIVLQTDQGADRFFRFQTASGQYRKEVCNIHVNNAGDFWAGNAFVISSRVTLISMAICSDVDVDVIFHLWRWGMKMDRRRELMDGSILMECSGIF